MCEDYFFFFFSLIYDGLSKFIQLLDIIISVTELFESYLEYSLESSLKVCKSFNGTITEWVLE